MRGRIAARSDERQLSEKIRTLYHYSIQSNKNVTAKSSAVNLLTDHHLVHESCKVSYINMTKDRITISALVGS